ncbi:MAG: NmrA family NAD(P)-binding protein [Archangiaceae bacterium]|nr:NmrA family NAD(P)-binding protein [Archangiaceae bacterium]
MTARVLVTGALGNVGQEVVRACRSAGFLVRATGAPPKVHARWPDVEAVEFDFTKRATWAGALDSVDFVFLLRPPPLGHMSTTINPCVDAAYSAKVKHVVFLSVAGAETKTWVPHRKVEDHLKATGTAWTILRPGFFAQNLGDAYLRDLVEDDRLFVPAARGRVAFLDVVDVGDVVAKVLENPLLHRGRAYRLAGPEAVTFDQLATLLTDALGRSITYRPASIASYAWHLWRHRRLPLMQVVVQTVLHVGLRSGDAEAVDDVQRSLLGREATPLRVYLGRSTQRWTRAAQSA